MDNRLEALNFFSEEFSNLKENETVKIFSKNRELCGFLEKFDRCLIIFNEHRKFEGFCAANGLGNVDKFNFLGNFDGYFSNNASLIKFGKAGEYKGYYVAENDCLNEFDNQGYYLGYFTKENNGSVSKYDAAGKLELFLEKD